MRKISKITEAKACTVAMQYWGVPGSGFCVLPNKKKRCVRQQIGWQRKSSHASKYDHGGPTRVKNKYLTLGPPLLNWEILQS
jgi:hypothetical protein